jgi:hypothetical protein
MNIRSVPCFFNKNQAKKRYEETLSRQNKTFINRRRAIHSKSSLITRAIDSVESIALPLQKKLKRFPDCGNCVDYQGCQFFRVVEELKNSVSMTMIVSSVQRVVLLWPA